MGLEGFRRLFRAPELTSVRRDVDDELAFHFEMRVQELLGRGLTPEEARDEAERAFGNVARTRQGLERIDHAMRAQRRRAEWGWNVMGDIRLALRGLGRRPSFMLAVVVTLALGIGANVTMFGIADRLLLRGPAHVPDHDLVRRLYVTTSEGGEPSTSGYWSWPNFEAIRDALGPDIPSGSYFTREFIVGEGEGARRRRVTLTTPGFFAALRVAPNAGRTFVEDESAVPIGARVAVVTAELAERELGGVAAALGRTITIAGQRFQIVGVMPPRFTGVDLVPVDVFVPIGALAAEVITTRFVPTPWHEARNLGWLRIVVRVPERDMFAQVEARATAGIRRGMEARWSADRVDSLGARATLAPVQRERGPEQTPASRITLWLAGMSTVVLLIACANVTNLLLARALRRRREVAVRIALGAGRRRLIGQLVTEGLILSVLAGAASLVVVRAGGDLVRTRLLPNVDWGAGLVDGRTFALAMAVALVAGLLTSLVPALQAGDLDLVRSLKSGAREGGGRRSFTRGALVATQAALSLVLLVGAGLFFLSLRRAQDVELGFDASRVVRVNLDFAGSGYSTADEVRIHDGLAERLRSIPGVASAAVAVTLPFYTTLDTEILLPGRDSAAMAGYGIPSYTAVSEDYFATIGTPIVHGRPIATSDREGTSPVMVVNETMARRLWPEANPLGECVILPDVEGRPCVEVVGVARDVRWNALGEEPGMQFYLALAQRQHSLELRELLVRTTGEPMALARTLREEALGQAPRVLFATVQPLASHLDGELRPWRLGATVFAAFGALALVLAALGLYSVIAYDVAQRSHEMGVRMALGASMRDILRLVVGEGVRVVVAGIALGGVVAVLAGRAIGPLLFDTRPDDPLVLGTVTAVLVAVAVAASMIPAWRAARVAPGVALRAE